MRRRLIASTLAIVLVVLGALAAPVGILVYRSGEQQIEFRLEQQLAEVVAAYNVAAVASGDDGVDTAVLISLLDVLGPRDGLAVIRRGVEAFEFVPFASDSTRSVSRFAVDGALLSVSTDSDPFDEDFRRYLNVLLLLVLGGLAAAAGLAAVQARQLARPLERLARRATALGSGDFSVRPHRPTAVAEIDDIARALDVSAERVGAMLAAERHFTADATHQLRTAITGISIRLELLTMHDDPTVVVEAREGLAQIDRLDDTIDDLLAAARSRFEGDRRPFALRELVTEHVAEWRLRFQASDRDVRVDVVGGTGGTADLVRATHGLVGQVLGILLENSLRHGAGTTVVTVSGSAVEIVDDGPGVPDDVLPVLFDGPVDPAARHGRGLSLARRLAQVDGASLDLVQPRPARFVYRLVPAEVGLREMRA